MMNDEPKFRYYKIEGDALEILKAYKAELENVLADREKLETDFMERAHQQSEYHTANLRAMWQRLAASVGLDPDNTFGSPEFQIEARYLKDGFGAILYMPRHINPLQDLLSGEPVGQPSNPETDIPPEGTARH